MPLDDPKPHPEAGIDVAIPCYQYGHFLRECVQSLLRQNVRALRVLIIDNASTDNSLEVAQQLARENRAVEVVAHRRNMGPHASFNEAVDWASQKYFLLLCADDMSAPGALARAVDVLEHHPEVVLSYGPAALTSGQGPAHDVTLASEEAWWNIFPGDRLLSRFCGTGVCHIAGCTAIVRTEVQKQVGHYRRALPHTDDFEMWMRFCQHGSIAETSATQGIIRAHEDSQSDFVRQQHRWDILHCEDAFDSFFAIEGARLPNAGRLHRLAKRNLGARAYWSAVAHLTRGDLEEAFAIYKVAIELRPSCALIPPVAYLLRRQDRLKRFANFASQLAPGPRGRARPIRAEV